jgi:hypothetical protein
MAIFESSTKRKPGTRSNTKLMVSGGQSPAGQWITDPNLPILFHMITVARDKKKSLSLKVFL